MNVETARSEIHSAIQDAHPFNDEEGLPDAGVVTGWVAIVEWQGSDGNRWLSKLSSNATADKGLPSWHERGFCQEVVYHWPDPDEA